MAATPGARGTPRPTFLTAHAARDRAVWTARGGPAGEILADVDGDVILSRLLGRNGERAAHA
jgi:hypothetical protein